jgi:hypothetical protein
VICAKTAIGLEKLKERAQKIRNAVGAEKYKELGEALFFRP